MTTTSGIGGASRPLARGRDDAIAVADEMVVYRAGSIHRLNPTAALVWSRCDGVADLETLAAELAVDSGADPATVRADVVRTVAQLHVVGLVALADDPESVSVPVVEPAAACSGCGSGPRFERHVLVAVADGVLAVGADAVFADALAAALGDRVVGVVDEPEARAGYGVVLPVAHSSGPLHELARLHRGPDVLARHRRPEPVIGALLAHIGAHELPDGHALLEAFAVGSDAGVVLVPIPRRHPRFERALADAGVGCSSGSTVVIPPYGRTVIIGAPWLAVDPAALGSAVADRAWSKGNDAALDWGTYEVVGLAASAPSAARAFGEMGPTAPLGRGRIPLDRLRTLADAVPVISADDPAALAALVTDREGR